MKAVRHFGVILLLLLTCAAPVMACLTPDIQMTAAERACCRMMRNQCGQMQMPDSENCCATTPDALFASALKSTPVNIQPNPSVVLWVTSPDVSSIEMASRGWTRSPVPWPPESPPTAIAILRI